MYSRIINTYFEQISIYKSIIVVEDDLDTSTITSDLLYHDFPVKEFNVMVDRDWDNERMYLVTKSNFGDLLHSIDYENITVIFAIGDGAYDFIHEFLSVNRKMFKCYIIRL